MLVLCGYRRGLRAEHRVQIQFKRRKKKSGDFLTPHMHRRRTNVISSRQARVQGLTMAHSLSCCRNAAENSCCKSSLMAAVGANKPHSSLSSDHAGSVCPKLTSSRRKVVYLGEKICGAALRPPVLTPSQSPQIRFCKKNLL